MGNDSTVLLGLDLGTSGIKALVLGADGRVLAEDMAAYPLSTPRPGWSEQDPEHWWQGAVTVIRAVIERASLDPARIAALAVSGQMHGATLLDAAGVVIRPCILWNDQRTGPECARITAEVGLDRLLSWVANPALPGFTAPKLLWLRSHEPENFARLSTVLLPKDYLNFRLTGELATEVSDASGTLLFDVARRRWSSDMPAALDLPMSLLPQVHDSTAIVGRVTAEAARLTGLTAGTPVVAGGADNACAAVGMGVVRPNQVLASLGTSGTVVAPVAEPFLDPAARLHTFCHAVPNTWYLMGVVLSAAGSLRWLRDVLIAGGRDSYDELMAEAAEAPPGSEGLVFLPYLSGERTPHADPHARGVFFGLSLRHTRGHLTRSLIEGVSFALADSAALMRACGVAIDTIRVSGGGARSRLWRQLLADILEAQVLLTLADAGPAFGAAIIAGAGVGVFPSIPAATDALVHLQDELAPEPASVLRYREFHGFYDSLYPVFQDRFAALSQMMK